MHHWLREDVDDAPDVGFAQHINVILMETKMQLVDVISKPSRMFCFNF